MSGLKSDWLCDWVHLQSTLTFRCLSRVPAVPVTKEVGCKDNSICYKHSSVKNIRPDRAAVFHRLRMQLSQGRDGCWAQLPRRAVRWALAFQCSESSLLMFGFPNGEREDLDTFKNKMFKVHAKTLDQILGSYCWESIRFSTLSCAIWLFCACGADGLLAGLTWSPPHSASKAEALVRLPTRLFTTPVPRCVGKI